MHMRSCRLLCSLQRKQWWYREPLATSWRQEVPSFVLKWKNVNIIYIATVLSDIPIPGTNMHIILIFWYVWTILIFCTHKSATSTFNCQVYLSTYLASWSSTTYFHWGCPLPHCCPPNVHILGFPWWLLRFFVIWFDCNWRTINRCFPIWEETEKERM